MPYCDRCVPLVVAVLTSETAALDYTCQTELLYNWCRLVGHGIRVEDVLFGRRERTGNGLFMSNVERMMDKCMR